MADGGSFRLGWSLAREGSGLGSACVCPRLRRARLRCFALALPPDRLSSTAATEACLPCPPSRRSRRRHH